MNLSLIITVRRDYLHKLKELAERFQQQGLTISQITDYGVIMGEGDATVKNRIRSEREVESVITDFYTQLPSPDSDIQ